MPGSKSSWPLIKSGILQTNMNLDYCLWAMLATDYDDVDTIYYPVIGQPKLNGVRAKWDAEKKLFISRQGEVWREELLPHLYHRMQSLHPTTSLDGELFSPRLAFQDICARVAVRRAKPHDDIAAIDFYAFDIINDQPSQIRIRDLETLYHPHIPSTLLDNGDVVWNYLRAMTTSGYEGIILRMFGVPYRVGRTEAVVKLKPWKYLACRVVSVIEGKGKLQNSVGAFVVRAETQPLQCKVGGGNITEARRRLLWDGREHIKGLALTIRYRDLSKDGKPLQPQIHVAPTLT